MTHTDDFDQTDAEILATTKALTDPAILQDTFCDFIGSGEGCVLLAIILGANSDMVKLEAINRIKAQYLDSRYTRIVIDAETTRLMY